MQYTERYEVRRKRKGEEPTTEVLGSDQDPQATWETLSRNMRPGEHIEMVRVMEVVIGSGAKA